MINEYYKLADNMLSLKDQMRTLEKKLSKAKADLMDTVAQKKNAHSIVLTTTSGKSFKFQKNSRGRWKVSENGKVVDSDYCGSIDSFKLNLALGTSYQLG